MNKTPLTPESGGWTPSNGGWTPSNGGWTPSNGGWTTELVEGQPIQVGRQQLIPVVKIRSMIRREITFGTQDSRGSGGGWVWLHPTAVILRRPDGDEEQVPIPDATGMAIRGMVIAALALPTVYLLLTVLAFVWRRNRRPSDESGQ